MRSPTRGALPLFDPPFPPVVFPEFKFLLVPVWKVLRPLVKSTRPWEEANTERRGQRQLGVAPERLLIAETFHIAVLFCVQEVVSVLSESKALRTVLCWVE